MGGPWPMKAAMDSRPSAVSLKVWLRETRAQATKAQGPIVLLRIIRAQAQGGEGPYCFP